MRIASSCARYTAAGISGSVQPLFAAATLGRATKRFTYSGTICQNLDLTTFVSCRKHRGHAPAAQQQERDADRLRGV